MIKTLPMNLYASCHCTNLFLAIELTSEPKSYSPRACDCSFCQKHDAAWLSDPKGSMTVSVRDSSALIKYRQGDNIADFLLCANCGVLVGVVFEEQGVLYSVVNSKAVDGSPSFGIGTVVSPRLLDVDQKRSRWKELWFKDVVLTETKTA